MLGSWLVLLQRVPNSICHSMHQGILVLDAVLHAACTDLRIVTYQHHVLSNALHMFAYHLMASQPT